jgi:hypothetical protein
VQQHEGLARALNLNVELHTAGFDLHRNVLSTLV